MMTYSIVLIPSLHALLSFYSFYTILACSCILTSNWLSPLYSRFSSLALESLADVVFLHEYLLLSTLFFTFFFVYAMYNKRVSVFLCPSYLGVGHPTGTIFSFNFWDKPMGSLKPLILTSNSTSNKPPWPQVLVLPLDIQAHPLKFQQTLWPLNHPLTPSLVLPLS